jgi:uncharacterized membrane protein YphA (DoxX/SURF4 family)
MEQRPTKTDNWGLARRILTRFFFIYFILYIFPFPLDLFSDNNFIVNSYRQLWGKLVPLTGRYLLNIDVGPRGGDTLFQYTRILTLFIIAALGCLIWTIADRKRMYYKTLFYWLTVYVRFYLAYIMLDYGFAKVFHIQFMPMFPNLDQLVQTYGSSSPQGLLWKFMGYSKSYQTFTGIFEVIGGLLLLFRRTATLGALVLIALLSNVVMMNWSYDIPVKLGSLHLLLMAIFILFSDAKRLVNFFILNKPVLSKEKIFLPAKKWARVMIVALKLFFVFFLIFIPFKQYNGYSKAWHTDIKPPLYGIYNIETFVVNNDTLPPLTTDSIRWKRMIVEYPGMWANIQFMNENLKTYEIKTDTIKKVGIISLGMDSLDKFIFDFHHPAKDILIFKGQWKNDSVFIQMKKVDINQFRLVQWKSRWIYRGGSTNY